MRSTRHRSADAIIRAVADRPEPVAFLLWGRSAQQRRPLIDGRHVVLESNHPSPLSATRGPTPFCGSKPFSTANARLKAVARDAVDWSLTVSDSKPVDELTARETSTKRG